MFEKINLRGQVWFTSLQGKKRRRRQKRSGVLLARNNWEEVIRARMNQQEKRESELPVWSGINSLTYCEETLELGQVWACLHSPSQKTWFSQRGRSEAAILLVDSVFLLLLLLFFFSLSLWRHRGCKHLETNTQSRQLINISRAGSGAGD